MFKETNQEAVDVDVAVDGTDDKTLGVNYVCVVSKTCK